MAVSLARQHPRRRSLGDLESSCEDDDDDVEEEEYVEEEIILEEDEEIVEEVEAEDDYIVEEVILDDEEGGGDEWIEYELPDKITPIEPSNRLSLFDAPDLDTWDEASVETASVRSAASSSVRSAASSRLASQTKVSSNKQRGSHQHQYRKPTLEGIQEIEVLADQELTPSLHLETGTVTSPDVVVTASTDLPSPSSNESIPKEIRFDNLDCKGNDSRNAGVRASKSRSDKRSRKSGQVEGLDTTVNKSPSKSKPSPSSSRKELVSRGGSKPSPTSPTERSSPNKEALQSTPAMSPIHPCSSLKTSETLMKSAVESSHPFSAPSQPLAKDYASSSSSSSSSSLRSPPRRLCSEQSPEKDSDNEHQIPEGLLLTAGLNDTDEADQLHVVLEDMNETAPIVLSSLASPDRRHCHASSVKDGTLRSSSNKSIHSEGTATTLPTALSGGGSTDGSSSCGSFDVGMMAAEGSSDADGSAPPAPPPGSPASSIISVRKRSSRSSCGGSSRNFNPMDESASPSGGSRHSSNASMSPSPRKASSGRSRKRRDENAGRTDSNNSKILDRPSTPSPSSVVSVKCRVSTTSSSSGRQRRSDGTERYVAESFSSDGTLRNQPLSGPSPATEFMGNQSYSSSARRDELKHGRDARGDHGTSSTVTSSDDDDATSFYSDGGENSGTSARIRREHRRDGGGTPRASNGRRRPKDSEGEVERSIGTVSGGDGRGTKTSSREGPNAHRSDRGKECAKRDQSTTKSNGRDRKSCSSTINHDTEQKPKKRKSKKTKSLDEILTEIRSEYPDGKKKVTLDDLLANIPSERRSGRQCSDAKSTISAAVRRSRPHGTYHNGHNDAEGGGDGDDRDCQSLVSTNRRRSSSARRPRRSGRSDHGSQEDDDDRSLVSSASARRRRRARSSSVGRKELNRHGREDYEDDDDDRSLVSSASARRRRRARSNSVGRKEINRHGRQDYDDDDDDRSLISSSSARRRRSAPSSSVGRKEHVRRQLGVDADPEKLEESNGISSRDRDREHPKSRSKDKAKPEKAKNGLPTSHPSQDPAGDTDKRRANQWWQLSGSHDPDSGILDIKPESRLHDDRSMLPTNHSGGDRGEPNPQRWKPEHGGSKSAASPAQRRRGPGEDGHRSSSCLMGSKDPLRSPPGRTQSEMPRGSKSCPTEPSKKSLSRRLRSQESDGSGTTAADTNFGRTPPGRSRSELSPLSGPSSRRTVAGGDGGNPLPSIPRPLMTTAPPPAAASSPSFRPSAVTVHAAATPATPLERLRELETIKSLLTKEEYDEKRREILASI
jgi:hypothetical protein